MKINPHLHNLACLTITLLTLAANQVPTCLAAPFELFVAQSPPGPQNENPATWGGVLHYHLSADGETMVPGAGIDRANLADPAGLVFRTASSELFVGNRHGNNNPSSISRFIYNPVTRQLKTNGTITGNGLYGVHQMAFNPVTGELFAANVNSGVSRFTFDSSGNALPNGMISSGLARGVAVAPDGKRLYVTSASSTIRQFDLTTGTELATVTVPFANAGLHYFEFRHGQLYVAALFADTVYRYAIEANDDLTLLEAIGGLNDPVDEAFSPDGREMFVSGHLSSDLIYRFLLNPQNETWTETGTFNAQCSLGSIVTIPSGPEPNIRLTATNSAVVWWTLPADGWVLQQTTNISGGAGWADIQPPYQTNSTTAWITFAPPAGEKFFRLFHP